MRDKSDGRARVVTSSRRSTIGRKLALDRAGITKMRRRRVSLERASRRDNDDSFRRTDATHVAKLLGECHPSLPTRAVLLHLINPSAQLTSQLAAPTPADDDRSNVRPLRSLLNVAAFVPIN